MAYERAGGTSIGDRPASEAMVDGGRHSICTFIRLQFSTFGAGWPDDFDPKFPIFSEAIPSYLINFGSKFPVLIKIFEKIFPVTS